MNLYSTATFPEIRDEPFLRTNRGKTALLD